MKNKLSSLFIAFLLAGGILKAQTSVSWQPLAFASGMNSFKGVEGYCALTKCNGTESILIKWVNHNPYSVKAGWKDMVYTLDNRSLNSNAVQDSITLLPTVETMGECGGNNNQLVLKFSDFGTDTKNFNYLIALDFNFVVVPANQNK
jgi:hypothetical protein